MSGSRKKVPPPIPVIGAGASGDPTREEQLRKWEEGQQRRLAAGAAQPPAPAVVPVAGPVPTQAPASPAQATVPAVVSRPSAQVAAAGYLPTPEFTQPDSDDPQERLEFYSRGILAVQYAARANHERADQQRLIGLGLRLVALKEEELHKTAGFDKFGEMTEARFGIKKHQANNIIRVMPVAQALEDITTQELKERPLRVLVPVLEAHGTAAVRETWLEASRHGNVTDASLKQAATFLGYAPPKELSPVLESGRPGKPKEVESKSSESLKAVERIRSLAAQDPARARREAEELESAARELVEELAGKLE